MQKILLVLLLFISVLRSVLQSRHPELIYCSWNSHFFAAFHLPVLVCPANLSWLYIRAVIQERRENPSCVTTAIVSPLVVTPPPVPFDNNLSARAIIHPSIPRWVVYNQSASAFHSIPSFIRLPVAHPSRPWLWCWLQMSSSENNNINEALDRENSSIVVVVVDSWKVPRREKKSSRRRLTQSHNKSFPGAGICPRSQNEFPCKLTGHEPVRVHTQKEWLTAWLLLSTMHDNLPQKLNWWPASLSVCPPTCQSVHQFV